MKRGNKLRLYSQNIDGLLIQYDVYAHFKLQKRVGKVPGEKFFRCPGRNNGRNFSGIRALMAVRISHRIRY